MTAIDTLPARAKRPPNLKPYKRTAIVFGVGAVSGLVALALNPPQLDLLFRQPLVIQLHVYAAVSTFVLGAVILLARKGRAFHIRAGWSWVVLMAVTAGASLFITGLNGDWWSWIHILSGGTLLTLPFAIMAAKKRNIVAHRAQMASLYVGGMIIAGGFTFVPGRLMWNIFFG